MLPVPRGRWDLALSLTVAWMLAIAPLPSAAAWFWPHWPALVLIYWGLETGRLLNLKLVFGLGLTLDLLRGGLLGQQALRLTILAFLIGQFRHRIRYHETLTQALTVFVLLLNDRFIEMLILLARGRGWPPAAFWLAPLAGALVWPWVFLLLDRLRDRSRNRATR